MTQPTEGVYVHGLFLEGAGWNRGERRLEESNPKELYYQFPILHVTAISTAPVQGQPGGGQAKAKQDALEKTAYQCPVYKYPKRNDRYLIFQCALKAEAAGGGGANRNVGVTAAMKWKMCGVSLLCCKN